MLTLARVAGPQATALITQAGPMRLMMLLPAWLMFSGPSGTVRLWQNML